MSEITITTNARVFNSALERYMALTSKTPDEVLDKKGRDLGIRLFRGFRDRQWGGPRKSAGLAKRELAARTSAGKGTHVRPSLKREYMAQRKVVRAERRALDRLQGPHNRASARAADRARLRSTKSRVALWQKFVGREVGLRQKGIGVLAASFLWLRRRSSQARGTFFVKNNRGRALGRVERGADYLRIVGIPENDLGGLNKGQLTIDARYQVSETALREAAVDMMTYVQRKERDNFAAAFSALRGAA